MRSCCLAIALFLVFPIVSRAQDARGCSLRAATTPDRSTVFLLCENGVAFRSAKAGVWEAFRVPAQGRLRAIQFMDSNRGFVAGDSGTLLATQDGGVTWTRIDTGERDHFTDLSVAGTKVWVAGYNGTIMHSSDGGRTWERQRTFTTQPIESISFLNEIKGCAVGWSGLILRTGDGGKTWQQIRVPEMWETLSFVYFRDPQNAWATGMYGLLLHSRDGGATWERQQVPLNAWLGSIVFDPAGTGWAAAEYDLLRSDDGGESWHVVPLQTSIAVHRLVATQDSLLAAGPGFVLVRPHRENAWVKLDVDQLIHKST